MDPLLLSVVLAAGGATLLYALFKRPKGPGKVPRGTVTDERQAIYEMAIEYLRDPAALRAIAKEFDDQGLGPFAERLRKRAAVQELPEEKKAARRKAYRDARASTNVQAILEVAKAFDDDGSPGAAYNLRSYAEGLAHAGKATHGEAFSQAADFAGDPSFGGRGGRGRRSRRRRRAAPPTPPQGNNPPPDPGDDPGDGDDDPNPQGGS